VSWTLSTRTDAKLVNVMLYLASDTLMEGENPIIHSNRGGHYLGFGWLEQVE